MRKNVALRCAFVFDDTGTSHTVIESRTDTIIQTNCGTRTIEGVISLHRDDGVGVTETGIPGKLRILDGFDTLIHVRDEDWQLLR